MFAHLPFDGLNVLFCVHSLPHGFAQTRTACIRKLLNNCFQCALLTGRVPLQCMSVACELQQASSWQQNYNVSARAHAWPYTDAGTRACGESILSAHSWGYCGLAALLLRNAHTVRAALLALHTSTHCQAKKRYASKSHRTRYRCGKNMWRRAVWTATLTSFSTMCTRHGRAGVCKPASRPPCRTPQVYPATLLAYKPYIELIQTKVVDVQHACGGRDARRLNGNCRGGDPLALEQISVQRRTLARPHLPRHKEAACEAYSCDDAHDATPRRMEKVGARQWRGRRRAVAKAGVRLYSRTPCAMCTIIG